MSSTSRTRGVGSRASHRHRLLVSRYAERPRAERRVAITAVLIARQSQRAPRVTTTSIMGSKHQPRYPQPQRAGLLPGAQIAERPGGLTSTRPGPRCARPRARAPGARALPQPVFAGPARAALYARAPLVILTAPACSLGRRARTDRQRPGTHAYIT